MSKQAVLVKKSTKEIIRFATYPREDMQVIEDLDPDYEWLIENIPYLEPDYDPRIFILVTNKPDLNFLDTFIDHPLYPGLKEYRITYTPEKRSKAEIVLAIENAEKDANNLIWSESVHKDKMLFMLASAAKAASGFQLTQDEQDVMDEMSEIVVKLSKNRDNKNILVSQVNNDQEPNIDSGWEKN